jgi:hypothetical protein
MLAMWNAYKISAETFCEAAIWKTEKEMEEDINRS